MQDFLFLATIYLAAAVIAVPLAVRLGLGSVLGYLLAGIFIGRVFGLGSETQDLQHFAEFGVVMMLFLIGLELDPRALWGMRHRLLGLGGAQIVLTTVAVMGVAMTLGYVWQTALTIGLVLALSSTAIVLQTLNEKGLMQTAGGRSSFSVLLTQDIAVIPMLAIVPLLAVAAPAAFNEDGSIALTDDHGEAHHAMSLVEGLPAWGVTSVTLAAVVAVILFGRFATHPLFRFVHQARLRELYTAFALLIVVGIALLMALVGLSPALGAFLGGVVLANSEFRHELESDIEPFKGLLLGLFFITVGAGINFAVFLNAPFAILGMTLALMVGKGLILYLLAVAFRLKGRDKWLFTLGLAQAGEFGFVLVSFSLQQQALTPGQGQTLLLVVALSMLLTPLFFIGYEWLSKRLQEHKTEAKADEIDERNEIIIAGIGRFGQVVNRLLQLAGYRATVLDHNLETIHLMRRFGFKGFFGDPTRPDLLHAAGIKTAKILVVAVDDKAAAVRLVRFARRERPDIHIVARAHDRTHTYELYQAGADQIVREMFDSALRAGRYVLENMGLTDFEANEIEHFFFRKDREALRDLAALWDPDVPVAENTAYIERSRELNKELETALVRRFDTADDTADAPAEPDLPDPEDPAFAEPRRQAGE
ncbi:MAG: monovalent cation:proton antiporter-2 (CPA2) family protein [Paracoccaceae bacterium]|nr:monovalent cation:proton antiporter-2 (CPA2) family protein [Paracoccaceae bacterium]